MTVSVPGFTAAFIELHRTSSAAQRASRRLRGVQAGDAILEFQRLAKSIDEVSKEEGDEGSDQFRSLARRWVVLVSSVIDLFEKLAAEPADLVAQLNESAALGEEARVRVYEEGEDADIRLASRRFRQVINPLATEALPEIRENLLYYDPDSDD